MIYDSYIADDIIIHVYIINQYRCLHLLWTSVSEDLQLELTNTTESEIIDIDYN